MLGGIAAEPHITIRWQAADNRHTRVHPDSWPLITTTTSLMPRYQELARSCRHVGRCGGWLLRTVHVMTSSRMHPVPIHVVTMPLVVVIATMKFFAHVIHSGKNLSLLCLSHVTC